MPIPTINAVRYGSMDIQVKVRPQPFLEIPVGSFFTFAYELADGATQFGVYYKTSQSSYCTINSTVNIQVPSNLLMMEAHLVQFPESYAEFEGLVHDSGW